MEQERFHPHSAKAFAAKYASTTSEKQYAQTFWRDFFSSLLLIDDLLSVGVDFEVPVRSYLTGKVKWIDVLWPGVVLIEHKSAGEDLDKAEEQAREYLQSLEPSKVPPIVIVCDFARIRIIELLAGKSVEFNLSDINDHLPRLKAIFENKGLGSTSIEISADSAAADLMAKLFVEFEKAGYSGHETSVFLVRVLFLLFAEDTRMMKRGIFSSLIADSPESGAGLGAILQELFQILDTPKESRPGSLTPSLSEFPYVNGRLFSEGLPNFSFTASMRQALVDATQYDWSRISPQIFGSLFQSVRDAATRREMGEHFTSEQNIMKVLSDLFLNDFTARLNAIWDNPSQLRKFHKELADYHWFDPACGSGNFLVVALKQMRAIELRVVARLQELEGSTGGMLDATWGQNVTLHQFHGIEIDDWSASIARVALHLADHQANLELELIMGSFPNRLPLTETANIVNANALQIPWESVVPMGAKTFIMGNPPFYGARLQTKEQKADTKSVWGNARGLGEMDFVSNWYVLAGRRLSVHGGQAAFVSTNSITQGEQPGILWTVLKPMGISISFAHRTFAWSNDARGQAAVHCVIIGLSTNPPKKRRLWSYQDIKGQPAVREVANINAFLLDAPDVIITNRTSALSPETPRMDLGSMPNDGGHLSDISAEEADAIRKADPTAAKYLRKLIGARELIHNEDRYCLWLEGADPNDIRSSPELTKRVQAVRDLRAASKREATQRLAGRPAEFGEIRQPKSDYLAVPQVTSEDRDYLQVAIMSPDVVANNRLSVVQHKDLDVFAIMVSRVFTVWNKAVSGRLESRLNLSVTITYNNFPFPVLDDQQRELILRGAESVLVARSSFPFNSLADLYGSTSMPPALRRAHESLDKAVLRVYGLPSTASDDDILKVLFERYKEATDGVLYEPAKRKRS